MSLRTVDPGEVWVRHISRCLSTDPGAVKVGGVWFRGNSPEGVNGESGWIGGEIVSQLSDEGSVTLRFPNGTGADGVAHIDRFAVITDPDYRIGEEWFEIRRDVGEPMAVVSPSTRKTSRTDITIDCVDPLALTTLAREEAVHAWDASPRDAIDFYTRLEMAQAVMDFRNKSGADLTAAGWTAGGSTIPSSKGISKSVAGTILTSPAVTSNALAEAWSLSVSGVFDYKATPDPTAYLTIILSGHANLVLYPGTNRYMAWPAGGLGSDIAALDVKPGGTFDVRAVRRGRWVYMFLNGKLIYARRTTGVATTGTLTITNDGAGTPTPATITSASLITVEPFLEEPSAGDRCVPGAPTPGGLIGRFFAEGDASTAGGGGFFETLALDPLKESTVERLDPVNHAVGLAFAPAEVGTKNFSARWVGSVYLDLASADRTLRVVGGSNNDLKVWVGKTGPAFQAPYALNGGSGTATGLSLRTHVGQSKAGWYPIIIETMVRNVNSGVALEDRAGAGAYAQVSTDRLSPYGAFSDTVQREAHRAMVSQLTEAFGYQWVIEPKTLESGKFPGRLVPKTRVGRDTEKVIETDESSQMEVTGSAVDSCDRLFIDAAGLPTKNGAAGMHVEVINDSTIRDHLYVSTAYDQATEITDETMLRQRADSMLTLRAGAFEQIKVEPPGQVEVVDTWPLTGNLATLKWDPGDAVRLNLPEIGQIDVTPRQLTGVTKPIHPGGVGAPSVTWRQRPRGAREMILRALKNSLATRRTYQNALATIDGTSGANPTAGSPTTPSVLFLPAGSTVVRLELRIAYLSGSGTATIEINGSSTGHVVTTESPIDLTAFAAPITPADQRITARLISVTNLLAEIQLAAMVVK